MLQVIELKQQLSSAQEQERDVKHRFQETGHLLDTRTADLKKSGKNCAELEARVAQLVILEQDGESSLAQLQVWQSGMYILVYVTMSYSENCHAANLEVMTLCSVCLQPLQSRVCVRRKQSNRWRDRCHVIAQAVMAS